MARVAAPDAMVTHAMAAHRNDRLKAADVCQLAQVQPYVLRSWEAEFPDLGRATDGGARVYERADVERVLKIRALVFGEGLTLAGARRRLDETKGDETETAPAVFALVDAATRARLASVRDGLLGVLAMLDRPLESSFALASGPAARPKPAKRGKR